MPRIGFRIGPKKIVFSFVWGYMWSALVMFRGGGF